MSSNPFDLMETSEDKSNKDEFLSASNQAKKEKKNNFVDPITGICISSKDMDAREEELKRKEDIISSYEEKINNGEIAPQKNNLINKRIYTMLKTILSISGKPGVYKLISQGKNMLIVESISADKKRFPAYGNEKIISLADIAMYTDDAEVPLYDVLEAMKKKENTAVTSIDPKKATPEQLREYLGEVLPNFDRERVYVADIKKLISWYNILISNGITEFKSEPEAEEEVATDEK